MSQVAHQARGYPGLSSMKQLGWDASPSQGYNYSLALNSPVPIYTPGWRETLGE